MSVRIFGIETTRHYQHQNPTSLEDARRQLAELEAVQQETWTALDNEPLPGTIKGFLNRKYPKIYASAGLRQLIAETCEARTLIARRRVAVLEAGLSLNQDDWVRLVADVIPGKHGVMLTATFRDELQRQRQRKVDGEECLVPYAGELSRAAMSHVLVLRQWKARKAAEGTPFVQPKLGREVWIDSDDPKPPPPPPPPPTPEEIRLQELEDDYAAFLERERAIRQLGEPRPPWLKGIRELLEQCDETRLLAEGVRKRLRADGDLSELVPYNFYWSFTGPTFFPVSFAVTFNGSDDLGMRMDLWHEALPVRARVAPEKALVEWEALRVARGEIAPPGPTVEEDLAALDLDNVTPRMAADILYKLQERARKEVARKAKLPREKPRAT